MPGAGRPVGLDAVGMRCGGLCLAGRRPGGVDEGRRHLLVAPLDEWSEGEIAYPNKEHGFGFFEAIRETFGEKGPEGWPVNAAPEDYGLVCPQRDLSGTN